MFATPAVIAQADWQVVGPAGGFFVDFAAHPTEPNVLLAGGDDSAGIWRSKDDGQSWTLVSEQFRNATGWKIAFDPNDARVVYATDFYGRHPVLRSNDSGLSWALKTSGLTPLRVASLAVDPVHPGTVYVGTGAGEFGGGNGVYRSTDYGDSWSQRGLDGKVVSQLAIDNSGTLFATTTEGLNVSIDAGLTWRKHPDLTNVEVTALTVSPTLQRVWVGQVGFPHSLYASLDGGRSFRGLFQPLRFIWSILVDPEPLERTLYHSSILSGIGVSKSTDFGLTWSTANTGLDSKWILTLGRSGNGTLFSSNFSNEGIYRSTDKAAHWAPSNNGLNGFFATSLSVDPHSSKTLYATPLGPYAFGDNAGTPDATPTLTQRGTISEIDGSVSWSVLPGVKAQTYSVSVSPTDPSTLVYGTFEQGFFVTDDGGLTSRQITATGTSTATAFDPDRPVAMVSILDFLTFVPRLWRSEDNGANWSSRAVAFVANRLLAESGSERVWAATSDGVWVSLDNGESWNRRGLDGIDIQDLARHPTEPNIVYAAGSDSNVHRSEDTGGTWLAIELPGSTAGAAVKQLVVDPLAPDTVFAGMNGAELRAERSDVLGGGVWMSTDRGSTWKSLATPALHNDHIWGMEIADGPDGRSLYVATYGAGVLRIGIAPN